jgi:hypothetical protein
MLVCYDFIAQNKRKSLKYERINIKGIQMEYQQNIPTGKRNFTPE